MLLLPDFKLKLSKLVIGYLEVNNHFKDTTLVACTKSS